MMMIIHSSIYDVVELLCCLVSCDYFSIFRMQEYLYYKYFKLKQKTRIYCVKSTLCPTTMHSQSILKMHKKCLKCHNSYKNNNQSSYQIWRLSDKQLRRSYIHTVKQDGRTNKWTNWKTRCPHMLGLKILDTR